MAAQGCRKAIALVAALGMLLASGCQTDQETGAVELHVFAAASLTEVLTEAAELYETVQPSVELVFTFDSSGTLADQIGAGAAGDIFISAAEKAMNDIDRTTGGRDLVWPESRVNLFSNSIALVVQSGNPAGIQTWQDLAGESVKLVALGNSDVPVGQYSEDVLQSLGLWDLVRRKASLGSNVKEVASWVSEGAVDCGMVYATDAAVHGLDVIAQADERLLSRPIVYPAAVLVSSRQTEAAADFLAFLQGPESVAIFETAGFLPCR